MPCLASLNRTDFPRRDGKVFKYTATQLVRKGNYCLEMEMNNNKTTKPSLDCCNVGKVSNKSTKCGSMQKAMWKIVGDKVELSPGNYTIEDLEAMLAAIQGVREGRVPCKGKAIKRTSLP